MTLAEFILARIADDEAAARAANGPRWEPGDGNVSEGGLYAGDWAIAWFEMGWTNPPGPNQLPAFGNWERRAQANADHAARHDPARVLADCAAKRRIVELHTAYSTNEGGSACEVCDDFDPHGLWAPEPGVDYYPCETLRLLALPYADHPDYQQEWAA